MIASVARQFGLWLIPAGWYWVAVNAWGWSRTDALLLGLDGLLIVLASIAAASRK